MEQSSEKLSMRSPAERVALAPHYCKWGNVLKLERNGAGKKTYQKTPEPVASDLPQLTQLLSTSSTLDVLLLLRLGYTN